jgi:hypothetical protein
MEVLINNPLHPLSFVGDFTNSKTEESEVY